MQCLVPFMEQSLCQHPWDNGLQWWVYNGCTVRYVYRIFEYLLVLGIFDSLGFRILVLVLGFSVVWHLSWQLMIYLLSSRFKQVWLATTCKLFSWAIRLSCSNLPNYTVGTYQPLAQALLTPKFVGCTTNYTYGKTLNCNHGASEQSTSSNSGDLSVVR